MQKIKAFIPHLFTLGNLFCGCLGIIYAFGWHLDWAAYMVFLAAFLDFFDGFFARILKVPSELGKQLDSLADLVSFGVLPGLVMFQWLKYLGYHEQSTEGIGLWGVNRLIWNFPAPWYCYIALMIPIFSCFRLAKFNLDTRQSHGFMGLPTPANAIFFVSMVLTIVPLMINDSPGEGNGYWDCGQYMSSPEDTKNFESYMQREGLGNLLVDREIPKDPISGQWFNTGLSTFMQPVLFNKYAVLGLIVFFSLLLVSELPLFALKFKNFGWNDNKIRYLFLALAAGLLICFWLTAIPFIVILYLLLSILNNIFKITV